MKIGDICTVTAKDTTGHCLDIGDDVKIAYLYSGATPAAEVKRLRDDKRQSILLSSLKKNRSQCVVSSFVIQEIQARKTILVLELAKEQSKDSSFDTIIKNLKESLT